MARILLIEGQEHIRFLYSEELIKEGHEVFHDIGSIPGTLERIKSEKPDLVLINTTLPLGTDFGLQLLNEIRDHFYNLAIILYGSFDRYKEDMRSTSADFHIIMSFDTIELKQKISMALEINEPYVEIDSSAKPKVDKIITDEIKKICNYSAYFMIYTRKENRASCR